MTKLPLMCHLTAIACLRAWPTNCNDQMYQMFTVKWCSILHIAQHREEFNEACRLDITCEQGNSFRYLHRMSADGTCGDDIILSAAARLYGTPIHLITTDGNRHVEINLPGTHSGDDSLQLGYIVHSGVDKNHFVSIVHKARKVADDSKTDNTHYTLQFKTKAAGSGSTCSTAVGASSGVGDVAFAAAAMTNCTADIAHTDFSCLPEQVCGSRTLTFQRHWTDN